MAGASSLLSKAGSVAGPAGGHSSWPSLSRPSSARSASSAPDRPAGGSIQPRSAPRCWSSRLLWPVAQCRDSRSVADSSIEEPGTRARSARWVNQRPSIGTCEGAGYGLSGSSSAVRRNRIERPSSRTYSMPARLGTISCGASTHSSVSTLTRLPVSGSVSLRSAGSTTSAYASMWASTCTARSARKAQRRSRSRGWGITNTRGSWRSVPTMAPSGAPASPAVVSGTKTIGRSLRWRCRTVASGWARPARTASSRARVLSRGMRGSPGRGAADGRRPVPGPRRAAGRRGAARRRWDPRRSRPRRPPRGRPRRWSARPAHPVPTGPAR